MVVLAEIVLVVVVVVLFVLAVAPVLVHNVSMMLRRASGSVDSYRCWVFVLHHSPMNDVEWECGHGEDEDEGDGGSVR